LFDISAENYVELDEEKTNQSDKLEKLDKTVQNKHSEVNIEVPEIVKNTNSINNSNSANPINVK